MVLRSCECSVFLLTPIVHSHIFQDWNHQPDIFWMGLAGQRSFRKGFWSHKFSSICLFVDLQWAIRGIAPGLWCSGLVSPSALALSQICACVGCYVPSPPPKKKHVPSVCLRHPLSHIVSPDLCLCGMVCRLSEILCPLVCHCLVPVCFLSCLPACPSSCFPFGGGLILHSSLQTVYF